MSVQQNNGFGRRVAPRPGPGASATATPGSPLVKQAGGILIGAAIALGLGFGFVQMMKYAGRTLDQKFVERATPGAPESAIKNVKNADMNLQGVQQTCTEQAKSIKLNVSQMRATDGYIELSSGEDELAHGAAFVECLATTLPARFCLPPHKAHLVDAVRQYSKLNLQMREAWFIATGGPGGANKAALMGTPSRLEQRVALGMPSAVVSRSMLASLRTLAADGYVTTKDFAAVTGSAAANELREALKDIPPKKAACG